MSTPASTKTIGIIHHLSSSGGTVISRCLASMPDVALLSEVHPTAAVPVGFFPIDPLGQFAANYADLLPDEERMYRAFRERVSAVADICAERNKALVLRDHSHSDYLTHLFPKSRLVEALGQSFLLKRIVTMRHPIDSYLSMKASGFDVHLRSFDDYCQRVLRFLDDHTALPLWRYEDFVAEPGKILKAMCEELGVGFDEDWVHRFNTIKLTGDSGRRPDKITPLPRRDTPPALIEEAAASSAFVEIAQRLNYE